MYYSEEELRERIGKLEGWKLEKNELVRKYMFNEYMKGIAFVDEAAAISVAFDHYPHIIADYKIVSLRLSAKEAGFTALELRQAKEFNEAFEKTR